MNNLRKFAAVAAASAALGIVTLSAGPALAQNAILQGWRSNGNPAWADQQPYLGENAGGYSAPGYAPGYYDGYGAPGYGGPGYGNGYAYGYGDRDAGGAAIAVCPDGYRLGRNGSLCWPD
jgi:hypothetical protein